MSGKLPIIAGIATMPGREAACKEAVNSLLGKVDVIYVYCNFPEPKTGIQSGATKVAPEGIFTYGPDMGDSGKFDGFYSFKQNGYKPFIYLSCDDDLIYPEGYVKTLVDAITKNPDAIYSHHGRVIPGRVKSYYSIGAKYPCLHDVRSRVAVNCVGTGVCGFRSDVVNISKEDFPLDYKNMADIHLAIFAQKNKIPMRVLPHRKGWIKHSPYVDPKQTIWFKHHKNDSRQTTRVNSWENWKVL